MNRPNTIYVGHGLGLRPILDPEPIRFLPPITVHQPSPRVPAPKQTPPPPPRRTPPIARGGGSCPTGYLRVGSVCKPPGTFKPRYPIVPPKPKPITCPSGQTLVSGKCVVPVKPPVVNKCPSGQTWNGTACVTASGDHCPPPGVVDAAGNCVASQPGVTCPAGLFSDGYGNCLGPGMTAQDSGAGAAAAAGASCPAGYYADPTTGACLPLPGQNWMTESTIFPGIENMWVLGGGLLAAYFIFAKGKR